MNVTLVQVYGDFQKVGGVGILHKNNNIFSKRRAQRCLCLTHQTTKSTTAFCSKLPKMNAGNITIMIYIFDIEKMR